MTDVCFLAGQLGRGGAERQLVYTLAALQGSGVRTRVLSLTRGDALEPELAAMGVPVTWVGRSESRLARTRAITRALQDDTPDIVQSAHFFTNIYAAMAGAAIRRPSIGAVRSDVAMEIRQAGVYGRAQIFMPRFLAANSRLGRDRLIDTGRDPRRVFVLPNAVDTRRFRPGDHQAYAPGERPFRILFVGNLYAAKRVDRFLRLLGGLRRHSPNLEFEARLVGSGPELERMRALAGSLQLAPPALVFENDMPDTAGFYHWADVLVLTSDHEGTPNAVLEAMASGLPVVATAAGGVPDLLAQGGGLLARADDEERLLAALVRVRDDRPLREELAREGLRFVTANHSLEGLQRRLLFIYAAVLTNLHPEPAL